MKFSKLILVLAMMFFINVTGCSKEPAQEADKSDNKETTQAVSQTEGEGSDSLTNETYPIRNKENPIVTIETDFGKLVIELYRDVAPTHVDSFLARSKDGFYNETKFHRIIKNFMIQGGDPKGNGTGGAGYNLNAEFSDLPHQEGTLSMARSQSPNSASSQFFLCLGRNRSTQGLDGKYTVFGQLIEGFDVLQKLGSVPVAASRSGERSQPVEDVFLRRAYLNDKEEK